MPRIFISHSHLDEVIAYKLVTFLLAALKLEEDDILCTSNPDQGLSYNSSSITDQLKEQLQNADALIILITVDSLDSAWIPFEAGSFWTTDKPIIPILGTGLTQNDLPGPLKNFLIIPIDVTDSEYRLNNAIAQLAEELNLQQKITKRREDTLKEFVDLLTAWQSKRPKADLSQQREIAELKAQIQNVEESYEYQLQEIRAIAQQEKDELEQIYQNQQQELERSHQSQITQLNQKLEASERLHKQQLQKIEGNYQQKKQKLEKSYQSKISQLEQEIEEIRSNNEQLESQEQSSQQQLEEIELAFQKLQKKQRQPNRRQFFKWIGLGSVSFITGILVNEIFEGQSQSSLTETTINTSETTQPETNTPNTTESTTLQDTLITKPQSISLEGLESFSFKTITVNQDGGVIVSDSSKTAKFFTEDLGNGTNLEMVCLLGRTFLMGSYSSEQENNSERPPG